MVTLITENMIKHNVIEFMKTQDLCLKKHLCSLLTVVHTYSNHDGYELMERIARMFFI